MAAAEGSAVMLLSGDYADSNVWSWWRRGRVERYLKHGIAVVVAKYIIETIYGVPLAPDPFSTGRTPTPTLLPVSG